MNIDYIDKPPRPEEFIELRAKAGLSSKLLKAAKTGLANSRYAVSIQDQSGTLIDMGRISGDGACNFELVDIAVDPDFQGVGIGRQIMNRIETYLQFAVLDGSSVSLIADQPALYEKLGYQHTAPNALSMTKKFTPAV